MDRKSYGTPNALLPPVSLIHKLMWIVKEKRTKKEKAVVGRRNSISQPA